MPKQFPTILILLALAKKNCSFNHLEVIKPWLTIKQEEGKLRLVCFFRLDWKTINSTTHWFPWVPFMHTLSIFDQLLRPRAPEGGRREQTLPCRLLKVGGACSTQDGLLWIINEFASQSAVGSLNANYTQALLAINHAATIHLPLSWGHIAGMKGVA